jgi:spermidine synthase
MERNVEYLQNFDGALWLTENDRDHLKISYKIRDVIFSESSPLQHVMILDSYDFGRMLVLDGVVQTTSIDGHIYNEMITHVPLHIHPNPKKVLIIGGGDCGAAREVAKYKEIEQIDMVEIDELVVKACKEHLPEVSGNLSDPRVNFIFDDGVQFAKNKVNEYDVIIVDSSDPVGPAEQLFEYEFYKNLHKALKEDGIMVCQSQSPIFHSSILKQTADSIRQLFTYSGTYTAVVPTYPGGLWSFTIGSKQHSLNPETFKKHPIETKYFNQEILKSCFALPEFMKSII